MLFLIGHLMTTEVRGSKIDKMHILLFLAQCQFIEHCCKPNLLLSHIIENQIEEFDDHVEINGVTFNKPFVEKPVSAEDHNIYMYYPTSAGMAKIKLFLTHMLTK